MKPLAPVPFFFCTLIATVVAIAWVEISRPADPDDACSQDAGLCGAIINTRSGHNTMTGDLTYYGSTTSDFVYQPPNALPQTFAFADGERAEVLWDATRLDGGVLMHIYGNCKRVGDSGSFWCADAP